MSLKLKKRQSTTQGSSPNLTLVPTKQESDDLSEVTVKDFSLTENTKPSGPSEIETSLRKKLLVFHKINDLFQETGTNFSKLTTTLLNLVSDVIDAEGGAIWLMADSKKELVCKGAVGTGGKELIGMPALSGIGIVGYVAEKEKAILVKDSQKETRFHDSLAEEKKFASRSLLACPLSYGGELVGVLEIVNKKGDDSFNQADMAFLSDICVPMAMHIKTSLVMRQQTDLIHRLGVIKNLQEDFTQTMELDKLLSIVLNKAIELLGAEVGSVWLTEESGEGIQCWVAEGPTKDKVIGLKVRRGTGIIGWVVENNKPSMVEDCSKDPRFSSALDQKINFVTRSMISAPLSVKGEAMGAIQIINKRDQNLLFTQSDLDFLLLFAQNASMYIKNARLYAAEKKAKELSALIRISKEVTSTLDLDSVLMSIVNLSSDIIPYDLAAISTLKRGSEEFVVRAISGKERVYDDTPEVLSLNPIHNVIVKGKGELLLNSSDEIGASDLAPEIRAYLSQNGIESFWAYVLKDDQGNLGVLSMESKTKNLINGNSKELLSILVSQCTVALRNAELYSTIPSTQVFGSYKEKVLNLIKRFRALEMKKQGALAGVVLAAFLSLIFVRIPYTVGAGIEIVPITTTYYAESNGFVKEVLVREGQTVNQGDILVRLDVGDLKIQKAEKESTRLKVRSEMIKLMMEEKVSDFKAKEAELTSLDYEISRLARQITKSEIIAEHAGTIVSEKLHELIGSPMNFGKEIIKVARTGDVFVEFKVPEEEIIHIRPGQELKFKVFGHPNHSFSDGLTVAAVAGEGKPLSEADPKKFFIARAEVKNTDDALLRPGMTGRGKIIADWERLGYVLLIKPFRFLMTEIFF